MEIIMLITIITVTHIGPNCYIIQHIYKWQLLFNPQHCTNFETQLMFFLFYGTVRENLLQKTGKFFFPLAANFTDGPVKYNEH